jgi:hypothetical protein
VIQRYREIERQSNKETETELTIKIPCKAGSPTINKLVTFYYSQFGRKKNKHLVIPYLKLIFSRETEHLLTLNADFISKTFSDSGVCFFTKTFRRTADFILAFVAFRFVLV